MFVGTVLGAIGLCEATYGPDLELEAGQLTLVSRVPQVNL
jgi:hypothetical protein